MTITTTQETPTATSTPEMRTTALADAAAPPRLVLDHHPGFSFTVLERGTTNEVVNLFDSDCDDFPFNITIDLFIRDMTVSTSIQPTRHEWNPHLTPDDLADYGSACDRLQQWFDDCASVLSWALRTYRGKEVTAMG